MEVNCSFQRLKYALCFSQYVFYFFLRQMYLWSLTILQWCWNKIHHLVYLSIDFHWWYALWDSPALLLEMWKGFSLLNVLSEYEYSYIEFIRLVWDYFQFVMIRKEFLLKESSFQKLCYYFSESFFANSLYHLMLGQIIAAFFRRYRKDTNFNRLQLLLKKNENNRHKILHSIMKTVLAWRVSS